MMENKVTLNKYAAAFTAICLVIGFAVGYSLFKENHAAVISRSSPFTGVTGASNLLKAVTELCSGTMLQFAVVFAAGFTLFSYPVCGAVLLYRGAACGYAASMTMAVGLTSDALPETVSYVVITLILSVLAVSSLDMSRRVRASFTESDGAPIFPQAASLVYLMLLTSGAAVFMKVLPLVIFSR